MNAKIGLLISTGIRPGKLEQKIVDAAIEVGTKTDKQMSAIAKSYKLEDYG